MVSLRELVTVDRDMIPQSIYHKNLKRVVYVTGDVAGAEESPVYAILKMNQQLDQLTLPAGYTLERYNATQPESTDHYSMKWDGEWQITIEVFRDLGMAFAAVLVLIYVLVVGWFRSFIVPLIIMAPIPLTLVGILPAHAMLGAFFTATSMIGFIAGAGIIVRNSIILVDFIELRRRRECRWPKLSSTPAQSVSVPCCSPRPPWSSAPASSSPIPSSRGSQYR